MPNPAPFAPISSDAPDWIQPVTSVNVTTTGGGTFTPTGAPLANNAVVGTQTTSLLSGFFDFGAAQSATSMVVVSASLQVSVRALTNTGVSLGQALLEAHDGSVQYLIGNFDVAALPANGQMPSFTIASTYPSGLTVPITNHSVGPVRLTWTFIGGGITAATVDISSNVVFFA